MNFVPHGPTLKIFLMLCLWWAHSARAEEYEWPVHAKAPPAVVQGFAEFGDVSKTKYHTGLDLGVSHGTAVFPVADGEVAIIQLLSATSDQGFGRTVVMRHGGPGASAVYSQYSHLSEIDAKLVEACKGKSQVTKTTLTCAAGVRRTTADPIGKSGGSGFGLEDKWPDHLHIEFKSFGTLCTKDSAGTVCGYSTVQPGSIGYIDPVGRLLWTRAFARPVPVSVTGDGVAVRFTPDAGQGKRSITTLDRTDTTTPLRGIAWSSGYPPCEMEGWIQVRRVDEPNCAAASGASQCFPDTRDPQLKSPDKYLGLVPTAWICGKFLSPLRVSAAREAVTEGVLFSGGSVKMERAGVRGMSIELVDRDGLFTVYESSRLGSDAISDVWSLIFLDLVYSSPPFTTFADIHRDLATALLARFGANCGGVQSPSDRAACAVNSLAKSRGIRMGGGRYDEGHRCVGWRDRPNGEFECRAY